MSLIFCIMKNVVSEPDPRMISEAAVVLKCGAPWLGVVTWLGPSAGGAGTHPEGGHRHQHGGGRAPPRWPYGPATFALVL